MRHKISLVLTRHVQVVMSADLDRMYSSLLNNAVPAQWAKVAYPSLKPLASWMVDLSARIDFMRSWCQNGAPSVRFLRFHFDLLRCADFPGLLALGVLFPSRLHDWCPSAARAQVLYCH